MKHDHEFDPKCPGCRPGMLDMQTQKQLPADHPAMIAANKAFDEFPLEKQKAINRVWVRNSRDPADVKVVEEYTARIRALTRN